ncbi:MAG TPA: hypothetical protein VKB80_08080 [Kofleriaceae bacterium]|nr:hypothetical protein [Kofleriaceae bacterium]
MVIRGRGAVVVIAALAALAPARARAGDPAAAPVDLVAALAPDAGAAVATAVLVGRSGQLYHPVAPGRWQRRTVGGVAVDLRGAVRSRARADEVLAIGADTPPFRFAGGAWHAEPLSNRGPTALTATGPLPVLVVGRHVYTLEGGAWVRRASAAHRVTAAWAAGPTDLIVAVEDGRVTRSNGRRFTPLRSPLPAGESIVALCGATPAAVFGRSEKGTWIRIDRSGAVAIAPAGDVPGFEEHAWGPGPDGALWLAGTAPAGGGRRALLLRADRNRMVAAADIPAVADGDRVVVVLGQPSTGEILIATAAGVVRVRDKKGTWSEGSASSALPPLPSPPAGGRSGAPARTR